MTTTRKRLCVIAAGLALALGAGATAHAADTDYQPKAGTIAISVDAAYVSFSANGKFTVAGQPQPGANLSMSNTATATFEAQYYISPEWSVSANVGVPPFTTATGTGTLKGIGKLGSVEFGPGASYVNYHINGFGQFQPFVAAGVTRMLVFADRDGAITRLNVHPSWGGAVRGGFTYMLTPKWGVNANVSHLFLRTHAGGVFSGFPVSAKAALDPTIVHTGVTMRF